MYKLVKLRCDCMDEFTVEGFWIGKTEEYEEWIQELKRLDDYFLDTEMYVGTNEYCLFDNFDDYFRNLQVINLSEEQAKIIISKFGIYYGMFIDPLDFIESKIDFENDNE